MSANPPKISKQPKKRRSRVSGGRPHSLTIRLSEEEYAALIVKSELSGRVISAVLVDAALKPQSDDFLRGRAARNSELSVATSSLTSVGKQLNELTRHLNTGQKISTDLDVALTSTLEQVSESVSGVVQASDKVARG